MAVTTVGSKFDNPKIIQDENGYVYSRLGKLNTYSRDGTFYLAKVPSLLYEPEDALLATRLNRQILFGEVNHPDVTGLEGRDLINKLAFIDNNNVSHHIKSIDFKSDGRTEEGWEQYPIVEMFGWVKPEGIKKEVLMENLYNPEANTLFSIRSICTEDVVGGQRVREVIAISTFDNVTFDGMIGSSKLAASGNESGIVDDNQLCLTGDCALKLRNIASGNEHGDTYNSIANAMDHMKIKTPAIMAFR